MTEGEKNVRKMIRRMNEIDRQEGRLRAFMNSRTYEKPSVKKKRKSLLAQWRKKIGVRDGEVRTLEGSIWKNGRLLVPREKPADIRSRIAQDGRSRGGS